MQLEEEGSPLVTSWTLVGICTHIGSSVLLGSTQHLATHVHEQVPKLQMLKEGDHVKVLRNAFSHHGIVVVPGELVIDFVSLGGSQSTCATNVGLLASRCGSASVASSSVASPIVTGSFLAS